MLSSSDLIHRRLKNTLSKKMHMSSCVNGLADNVLLFTLPVPGPFPNQHYKFGFNIYISLAKNEFFKNMDVRITEDLCLLSPSSATC